eukprot:124790-Lingulodinium_polyedra.AAC.1
MPARARDYGASFAALTRHWENGTRCARKALPWLIPCDISGFINLYPSVRHDKAFVVIIAFLKEPSATASF